MYTILLLFPYLSFHNSYALFYTFIPNLDLFTLDVKQVDLYVWIFICLFENKLHIENRFIICRSNIKIKLNWVKPIFELEI